MPSTRSRPVRHRPRRPCPARARITSGSASGTTGRSLITVSSSRPCTRRARTIDALLVEREIGRVEERDEADLRVERVEPERRDRGAMVRLGHGQLELDAVGARGQREHLREVLVAEVAQASPAGLRGGHGASVARRRVKALHPRGVTAATAARTVGWKRSAPIARRCRPRRAVADGVLHARDASVMPSAPRPPRGRRARRGRRCRRGSSPSASKTSACGSDGAPRRASRMRPLT